MRKCKWLLILLILLLVGCEKEVVVDKVVNNNSSLKNVPAEFQTFENTFLEDRLEGQWTNYGLGDPFIYRFNGVYYLICSTKYGERGVKGWKSVDLYNWEPVSNGVTKDGYIVSDTVDETFDAWASEVYYLDGTFYLVESRNGKGHYVLSSTSPEGPFEPITSSTIDNAIDGSLYMDIDGSMILLTADSSVSGAVMADDMKSVSEEILIKNTTMTGWTEGPEMLTRNGIRYYFYTGNGVTQRAYRIDYSYGPASESILDGQYVSQAHNVLLNTDDDWYGLGHGCVIMGPDLDSYYLGFHNSYMEGNSGGRRFNIGRLLFNGADVMMQHTGLYDNIMPNLPDYAEYDANNLVDLGDYKLSDFATKDSFTVEFNATGSGKMIFSYVDNNNYGYLTFDGRNIEIHRVSNGNDTVANTVKTYRDYKTEVFHSIKIGYKDGLMDVTFDYQEIANDISVGAYNGGQVGYSETFESLGCLIFNNTSHGDSDKETAKQENIPSPSYDVSLSSLSSDSGLKKIENTFAKDVVKESYEMKLATKGDYVTYLEYTVETGTYGLDMVLHSDHSGKTVGVQVDGGEIYKWTIPDYSRQMYKGYMRVKVADLYLEKGNHNITIYNLEDTIAFQMLYCERNYSVSGTVYEHDLKTYPEYGIGYPTFLDSTDEGLKTTNTARYLCTFGNGMLEDLEISCDIMLTGENGSGTLGLVIATDNWAFNNTDIDNYKSIQGYYFALNNTKVNIIKSNYQYSDESCRDIYQFKTGQTYNIKAVKEGKILTMYVNGEKVLETFDPMGRTRGYCGLYSNFVEVTFSNMKIKTL